MSKTKTVILRMPLELWTFASKKRVDLELSLNKYMIKLVQEAYNKEQKKLAKK